MERVTSELLRTYRGRALCPVIVEARGSFYGEVKDRLRAAVPVDLLEPRAETFFPRLVGRYQVPISKWKELPEFGMVATVLTPRLIEEAAQWTEVERIYPDGYVYPLQYPVLPKEGVYEDYRGQPFTTTSWVKRLLGLDRAGVNGSGVKAAVLDTGCSADLPQVVGVVKIHSAMLEKGGTGLDRNGHGTWVSSCLGGRTWTDRRYKVTVEGIAQGAELHSVQVLGFIVGFGLQSDLLEGMEKALGMGAKVVNVSLGKDSPPQDSENPEAKAISLLSERGVIVVVAAGNSGPEPATVGSPGSCMNSLTVGALDPFKGQVAEFSSRGPTKDGLVKPDVVSYGVRVHSQVTGLLALMEDPTDRYYAALSGTSMASPCAAGTVACMAELYAKHSLKLDVNEVKRMMEATGHAKTNEDGWGLLDWNTVQRWVETQYGIK